MVQLHIQYTTTTTGKTISTEVQMNFQLLPISVFNLSNFFFEQIKYKQRLANYYF